MTEKQAAGATGFSLQGVADKMAGGFPFGGTARVDEAMDNVTQTFRRLSATSSKLLGRARQLTEETLGNASKTELEELRSYQERVQLVKEQTEHITKELTEFVDLSPGLSLDRLVPAAIRVDDFRCRHLCLGHAMLSAANAYGRNTEHGKLLARLGEMQITIGNQCLEFAAAAKKNTIEPMVAVKDDFSHLAAMELKLTMLRLDLDAAKAKAHRASFHDRAEADMRQAQYDFDCQYGTVEQQLMAMAEIPADQAKLLHSLIEAQLGFHQKAAVILERMLQSQAALGKPPRNVL